MIGMMAIVGGIVLVFRTAKSAPADGEPGAAASGSFSCHLFYACSRQLILTSKGKYHGQHADDF